MILKKSPEAEPVNAFHAIPSQVQDTPPPYSLQASCPWTAPPTHPDRNVYSQGYTREAARSNQLLIERRHDNINGQFNIDPELPCIHTIEKKYWKKFSKTVLPNAVFRTRNGDISLNLAIGGHKHDVPGATIYAASRIGNISINLASIHFTKHINLDVYSKKGTILLLLPQTLCTSLHIRTKRGKVQFLPTLAKRMAILRECNGEALIAVGDSTGANQYPPPDICRLTTRTGNIIVGISGKDTYTPEAGLWKMLGEFVMHTLKK